MSMKTLSPEVHNPEFNEADKGLLDDMDGRSRIQVGGLRNRIVVIFRAEDREFLAGQLSFLV